MYILQVTDIVRKIWKFLNVFALEQPEMCPIRVVQEQKIKFYVKVNFLILDRLLINAYF